MATLPTEDREKIHRGIMRYWSQENESIPIVKADLYAAIEATDDWIDGNQASYNAQLPAAARNSLSQSQKTLLFCVVALARVSIEFLRRVIGDVE